MVVGRYATSDTEFTNTPERLHGFSEMRNSASTDLPPRRRPRDPRPRRRTVRRILIQSEHGPGDSSSRIPPLRYRQGEYHCIQQDGLGRRQFHVEPATLWRGSHRRWHNQNSQRSNRDVRPGDRPGGGRCATTSRAPMSSRRPSVAQSSHALRRRSPPKVQLVTELPGSSNPNHAMSLGSDRW